MEEVAKLKKQIKKLKETIRELEYQRDKKALIDTLNLDYYIVRRMSDLAFMRFEEAIRESNYLKAIDAVYGLEKVDELLKQGAKFENIIRALDEVYQQSVEARESEPLREEDLPF